jgi:hypothetical protein
VSTPLRSKRQLRNNDQAQLESLSVIANEDPATTSRQLHPLPRGLVELYGLLAVLFVLVPEWMADGALAGLRSGRRGSELPMTTMAWQRVPELRLASMNLRELRALAAELRLWGYGGLNRDQLSRRLLRRIKARRGKAL